MDLVKEYKNRVNGHTDWNNRDKVSDLKKFAESNCFNWIDYLRDYLCDNDPNNTEKLYSEMYKVMNGKHTEVIEAIMKFISGQKTSYIIEEIEILEEGLKMAETAQSRVSAWIEHIDFDFCIPSPYPNEVDDDYVKPLDLVFFTLTKDNSVEIVERILKDLENDPVLKEAKRLIENPDTEKLYDFMDQNNQNLKTITFLNKNVNMEIINEYCKKLLLTNPSTPSSSMLDRRVCAASSLNKRCSSKQEKDLDGWLNFITSVCAFGESSVSLILLEYSTHIYYDKPEYSNKLIEIAVSTSMTTEDRLNLYTEIQLNIKKNKLFERPETREHIREMVEKGLNWITLVHYMMRQHGSHQRWLDVMKAISKDQEFECLYKLQKHLDQ